MGLPNPAVSVMGKLPGYEDYTRGTTEARAQQKSVLDYQEMQLKQQQIMEQIRQNKDSEIMKLVETASNPKAPDAFRKYSLGRIKDTMAARGDLKDPTTIDYLMKDQKTLASVLGAVAKNPDMLNDRATQIKILGILSGDVGIYEASKALFSMAEPEMAAKKEEEKLKVTEPFDNRKADRADALKKAESDRTLALKMVEQHGGSPNVVEAVRRGDREVINKVISMGGSLNAVDFKAKLAKLYAETYKANSEGKAAITAALAANITTKQGLKERVAKEVDNITSDKAYNSIRNVSASMHALRSDPKNAVARTALATTIIGLLQTGALTDWEQRGLFGANRSKAQWLIKEMKDTYKGQGQISESQLDDFLAIAGALVGRVESEINNRLVIQFDILDTARSALGGPLMSNEDIAAQFGDRLEGLIELRHQRAKDSGLKTTTKGDKSKEVGPFQKSEQREQKTSTGNQGIKAAEQSPKSQDRSVQDAAMQKAGLTPLFSKDLDTPGLMRRAFGDASLTLDKLNPEQLDKIKRSVRNLRDNGWTVRGFPENKEYGKHLNSGSK